MLGLDWSLRDQARRYLT